MCAPHLGTRQHRRRARRGCRPCEARGRARVHVLSPYRLGFASCLTPTLNLILLPQEPPPADNPLVGRPDVVCTPHLGASTAEAQEDVAVEIAEVVVAALQVRCAPHAAACVHFCKQHGEHALHTEMGLCCLMSVLLNHTEKQVMCAWCWAARDLERYIQHL